MAIPDTDKFTRKRGGREFRTAWKWVSMPFPVELKCRSGSPWNPGVCQFRMDFRTKEIPLAGEFLSEKIHMEM